MSELRKIKKSKKKLKQTTNKMKIAKNKSKANDVSLDEQKSDEDLDNLLRDEMKGIIIEFDKTKSDNKSLDSNNNNNNSNNNNNNKSKNKIKSWNGVKFDDNLVLDKNSNSNHVNVFNKINDNNDNSKQYENKSRQKKKKFLKGKSLLIKSGIKWYEMRATFTSNDTKINVSHVRQNQLKLEAKQLIDDDIVLYHQFQETGPKRADFAWISGVLQSGTLADKLAAHSILLQDSPIHNMVSLNAIIQMVNTKGKRECVMALDNLRELFIGDLLVPDSKLRSFSESVQYFNDSDEDTQRRSGCLVLIYFEDQLKNYYKQFLDSVAKVSHDTVETTKNKSLLTFFDLLVNNGEQEQYLLENLINKLGDPIRKLAAKASHFLSQLINQHHPRMKSVVVVEVERLIYRPNISPRAQYYGLCFLSEILFSADDTKLANKLIDIYFGFFKACVKKGDVNNKLMSVLLTGVTRAFPYSKLDHNVLEQHLETFYKLIHFVNFNTSIQALLLIFNILDVNQSGLLTDRFYSLLYRYVLNTEIEACSRKAMFLNLIFRAIKRDPIIARVRAFIKRLLQVALTMSSSMACSILILISEIIKSKPGLMLQKTITDDLINDDNDEEKYEDIPLSDDERDNQQTDSISNTNELENTTKPSWVHNKNIDSSATKTKYYDPLCRNPLYASAESVDLWEFEILKRHFHPSTNLFAQKIIDKTFIDYAGDPLTDFTIKNFLDRFVFRNPKKLVKGGSVFGRSQPKLSQPSKPAINSHEYVEQPENRVPLDELFIYRYLKQRETSKEDKDDIESVTSEEFERLLDHYEPGDKNEDRFDFASEFFKETKKSKNREKVDRDNDENENENENEADFDANDEIDFDDDDEDIDFDENDQEFDAAFEGIDSELDDALAGSNDTKINTKKRKKGFDKMTNDLFASADQFQHLLQQNESDSDIDDTEMAATVSAKNSSKRSKPNKNFAKPKLGRKRKRKTAKLSKSDIDL